MVSNVAVRLAILSTVCDCLKRASAAAAAAAVVVVVVVVVG